MAVWGHVGEVGIVMDADQLTAILAQIESPRLSAQRGPQAGSARGLCVLTRCVKTRQNSSQKNLDKPNLLGYNGTISQKAATHLHKRKETQP